ncbi:FxsA family protein [Candidatus Pelagibacter sp.]|nr:FxsA family protein [Candidatus Pelagibacter sp.]
MNSILLLIILIPALEIYLFIKIGSEIGAITTILLIFTTAIVGIYYAKYEGLNTLKSGFTQLKKNEQPAYEMISGAAIAFAALLLIIPGFATDIVGFLIILPISRKYIFNKFIGKIKKKRNKNNFIDGEFEDIENDDDRKI